MTTLPLARGVPRPVWQLLAVAIALRLVMAWANYGFVAMDDYTEGLAVAVPAQRAATPATVVAESGIRSPVPRLFIYGLAQSALAVGIEDPVGQVRFLYAALGILSVTMVAAVWWMFAQLGRETWGVHAAVWTGMHFLAVYLSTRTLLENLTLPFLTLAGTMLVVYHDRGRRGLLLGAMIALAIAAVFRFQAGVTVVALLAVPAARRAWRDLAAAGGLGLVLFGVTGGIDMLLRGEFHGSLRAYLRFNLEASTTFGTSPWYSYLLLLAAVAFVPLLVARYRGFPWREYGRRLWPLLLFVVVFVAAHSAVPHKEDRFMLPIMGVFFALLAPLSAHLAADAARSWRAWAFAAINATGLVLLAGVPSQYNVIGPVRYLDVHPGIRTVWSVEKSVEPYPRAYSARPLPALRDVAAVPGDSIAAGTCQDAVLLRHDLLDAHRGELAGFHEAAVFGPGLPERLIIRINPENNRRRSAVHLFLPLGCEAGG